MEVPVSNLIVVSVALPILLFFWREYNKQREGYEAKIAEQNENQRSALQELSQKHASDLRGIIEKYQSQIEKAVDNDEKYRELLSQMVGSIRDLTQAYDITERFSQLEQRIEQARRSAD